MTVEEQARAASSELRASVARSVSPESSRRQLGGQLRRRRVEQGVLGLMCLVLAVGVAFLVMRPENRAALPATVPTVDPTAAPASRCVFSVACTHGVYRAALRVPTTFSPAGQVDVASDTVAVLDLVAQGGTSGVTVIAGPGAAGGGAADVAPTSSALASWLHGRQDLVAGPPVSTVLAGRPAVQVDVRAAPWATFGSPCLMLSQRCLPLFSVDVPDSGPADVGLVAQEAVSVYLLDIPGQGTVVVLVHDMSSNGVSAAAVAQLTPVLGSLAFGPG